MMAPRSYASFLVSALALSSVMAQYQQDTPDEDQQNLRRRTQTMPYDLPASAAEWCSAPLLPPLPYTECTKKGTLNSVPLYGGLTNSLKIVLLGTILSFEEGKCFYVDESNSELLNRGDKSQTLDSFINRYFEPIGVQDKDMITKFKKNNKVEVKDWTQVWADYDHNRRTYGFLSTIKSLNYERIEGHHLKRTMMRRMWRPLPKIREQTCSQLASHGLKEDYITISIRQGDKQEEENFNFATMQQYIDAVEQSIPVHFGGKVPMIFVATDDCSVLVELRSLRPQWTFVSECDKAKKADTGFALADMQGWSQDATDDHYNKFFVELYAMAAAKVFIGIWYTNVTWWAFFMRPDNRSTFKLLDTPGVEDRESLDWW